MRGSMQPANVRVVPITPTIQDTFASLYNIECSHELPRINAKRTIKSVLLSPPVLRRCNALLHRFRLVLSVTNAVSSCLLCGYSVYPAPVGRWVAVITTPLMALPTTAIILGMRYDMAVLLVRTYDFWYQVLLSLVGSVAFAVGTRDMRGVCGFAIVAISVIVVLADVNFKAARFFFATSLITCGLCAASALFLMFGSIDEGHSRVFLEVDGHALTAAFVIADVSLVFVVIHARNAYVRRVHYVAS